MLWGCLSVSAAEARQGASREVKRLLYVTSYNASYKWTNDVITGFREYFQHVNYPVKIDVIELDVLRTPDLLPSPRDISATIRSLKTGNYDLVVAADNCAVELIQEHHRDISGQLPFVFCGYVHWQPLRRDANANLTGLEQPSNILPNVKLGLRLLPGTRGSQSHRRKHDRRAIRRELPQLLREIQGVEFLYLHGDDYTDEQLLQKIAGLPPDSFIIFTNWRSSLEENTGSFRLINDKIFKAAPVPVFTTMDLPPAPGVPGGFVTVGTTHGREAARLAEQVLLGEKADSIPILPGFVGTGLRLADADGHGPQSEAISRRYAVFEHTPALLDPLPDGIARSRRRPLHAFRLAADLPADQPPQKQDGTGRFPRVAGTGGSRGRDRQDLLLPVRRKLRSARRRERSA